MKKSFSFKANLKIFITFILTFMFALQVSADIKTVTGIVKDNTDMTLIGAAITVKNSPGVGTVTDIDGKYSLRVSSNDVLVYRYLGYQTKEEKVGNRSVINVTMGEDSKMLEDVVVVGYGSQKKESVVGAITQTKGEDLLQAGTVSTVSEALTGLLPGVSTMQGQGQPGSTAASILIRGKASWTNSSPLMLVDGVERDFNDLDPNEIESISVLKDASATAVFGVKAANGVILVTTKIGKKGKPKISLTANVGLKKPTIDDKLTEDYPTTMEYQNMAKINDNIYTGLNPDFYINYWKDPELAKSELGITDSQYKDFYSYTNYINELYSQGYTQQYNLNISGGNDFVSYFTSVGYNYDGDIMDIEKQDEFDPRTYQHKFNWRSNLDFNFTKTTKFSVKLSGDMTNWNGNAVTQSNNDNNGTGDIFKKMYNVVQIGAPSILSNGLLGRDNNNSTNTNYLGLFEREGSYSTKKNRLYTDFILKQKIFKDFLAQAKFSYNYSRKYKSNVSKQWNSAPIYYYVTSSDGFTPDILPNGNLNYSVYGDDIDSYEKPATLEDESINGYSKNTYYELSLNYNHSFGKHDVSALGLFQRRENKSNASFPSYDEGWVGRVTYGYSNKYLFEANGAYNGSEKFARGDRFGFFPSTAVGWVLSEEDFIKDKLPFIDFLKLRYSYGLIGSDKGVSAYSYISTYDNYTGTVAYGYNPSITKANKNPLGFFREGDPVSNVTWETSTKQDLGLEFNTLKNKLRLTLDLFDENRDDILMQRRSVPTWYGNEAPYANVGKTKNHGIDIDLKWNDKINSSLSYWLKGSISMSENRIVDKDDPGATPAYQTEANKPIGWQKGLKDLGIMQSWDDVYNYVNVSSLLSGNVQPGDLMYNDYNSDGSISHSDDVAIGNPSYATNSYSFSFGLQYKNWTLTSLFNGVFNISKALTTDYLDPYITNSSAGFMMNNNEAMDCWTPTNKNSSYHAMHATANTYYSKSYNSSYYLRNADFLRLRNLELKYSFSKNMLKRLSLSSLQLYVNGNNLYTWQSLPSNFDAEQKSLTVYPISKRYNIGLRMSF